MQGWATAALISGILNVVGWAAVLTYVSIRYAVGL